MVQTLARRLVRKLARMAVWGVPVPTRSPDLAESARKARGTDCSAPEQGRQRTAFHCKKRKYGHSALHCLNGSLRRRDCVHASCATDQKKTAKDPKEIDMRNRLAGLGLLSAVVMVTVLFHAGTASATDASGFTGITVAKGVGFPEFEVSNKVVLPPVTGGDDDPAVWLSKQKTKGLSDLYVINNTWAVGGTTGWHSHPGHSLIIVTAGTITDYESDDPTCTGKVYTTGMSFVDEGGTGHAHVIRNEGTVPAQNIVVQLVPTGGARRINVLSVPANCPITIQ